MHDSLWAAASVLWLTCMHDRVWAAVAVPSDQQQSIPFPQSAVRPLCNLPATVPNGDTSTSCHACHRPVADSVKMADDCLHSHGHQTLPHIPGTEPTRRHSSRGESHCPPPPHTHTQTHYGIRKVQNTDTCKLKFNRNYIWNFRSYSALKTMHIGYKNATNRALDDAVLAFYQGVL
jgi:hypothetical protein